MEKEVIRVVDTNIFKKELDMAKAVFPFVETLLPKKRFVAIFLGVTEQTVTNMILDGRLIEGVHYTREKKIQFVPQAIVEYKISPHSQNIKKYEPSGMAKDILS